MNLELTEDKIIRYFEGELPTTEMDTFLKSIEESPEAVAMFEEYKILYDDLTGQEVSVPSERMREQFETTLKQAEDANPTLQPKVRKVHGYRIMSIAAVGVMLLCICYLVKMNIDKDDAVSDMNQQLMAMRMDMRELLDTGNTTNRIKAVNMSYDIKEADPDIVNVLSETLHHDPSPNVRLAAATALSEFASTTNVKNTLIDALAKEDDPSVQIELINALSNIKEQRALPGFDKMLENENLLKFVKDEIHLGKIKIESI